MRIYHGFEKVLWFRFSHKGLLALVGKVEAGVNCAAMCGALTESVPV